MEEPDQAFVHCRPTPIRIVCQRGLGRLELMRPRAQGLGRRGVGSKTESLGRRVTMIVVQFFNAYNDTSSYILGDVFRIWRATCIYTLNFHARSSPRDCIVGMRDDVRFRLAKLEG